jgi:hypothetical protein
MYGIVFVIWRQSVSLVFTRGERALEEAPKPRNNNYQQHYHNPSVLAIQQILTAFDPTCKRIPDRWHTHSFCEGHTVSTLLAIRPLCVSLGTWHLKNLRTFSCSGAEIPGAYFTQYSASLQLVRRFCNLTDRLANQPFSNSFTKA